MYREFFLRNTVFLLYLYKSKKFWKINSRLKLKFSNDIKHLLAEFVKISTAELSCKNTGTRRFELEESDQLLYEEIKLKINYLKLYFFRTRFLSIWQDFPPLISSLFPPSSPHHLVGPRWTGLISILRDILIFLPKNLNKVVISFFVWISDHNSWTPGMICLKFWLGNSGKPRGRF